jgi:hypothetical protein
MKRLLTAGLLALILSCEQNNPQPTTYRIDEELLPYLETFLAEANSRGLEFERENLIIEFGTAAEEVCGQCLISKNGGQRKITIVQNSVCWEYRPAQTREALVFHELGHCLLERNHREDKLPNGAQASIMYSGNDGPYNPCVYVIGNDTSCNKTGRRSYYIDELFNPSTPVPDWGE